MSKRTYTVEVTYTLPVYKHVQVEASSAAQACEPALHHDDWEQSEKGYDGSGPWHVTGVWAGRVAYSGRGLRILFGLTSLGTRIIERWKLTFRLTARTH